MIGTSYHDTYNAKWLSPGDVARTFVPPPDFNRLIKRRNTLIVGPRGSGKTTLLKMLTRPALNQWTGDNANKFGKRIDYAAALIATDVNWERQLRALGQTVGDARAAEAMQVVAVTTHAHKALAEAMEAHAKHLLKTRRYSARRIAIMEPMFVAELARLWRLELPVSSFHALKAALRLRMISIYRLKVDLDITRRPLDTSNVLIHEIGAQPLIPSCELAIEQFNDTFQDKSRYWALLFDELELMPSFVRKELLASLRSVSGQLILKLAVSPYDYDLPVLESPTGPHRDHDFDFVPLWYAWKKRAYSFCGELWNNLVKGTPLEGTTASEALGKSLLDTDSTEWQEKGTAYTKNSDHYKYMRRLAEHDESFRKYLNRQSINLEEIDKVKSGQRASTLRKVFPIVVARVESRRSDENDGVALRSRKVSSIYTGWSSIFDIAEGNPRVFIGLVSRLIEKAEAGSRSIRKQVQADEITQAVNRYRAMIKTYVPPTDVGSQRPLLDLLDPIGKRFRYASLVASFSPEPPGSFVVDQSVDEDTIRLLGHALNMGAIVYVPEKRGSEEFLTIARLRERRFRLSYLFAAYFGIVPRLGRAVALSQLESSDFETPLFGTTTL